MAEQLNASPMRAPALHDVFTLLDGAKAWPLPGLARVTASLSSSTDTMQVPGDETAVAQTTEAGGEVKVSLTMTTDEEWRAYQSVLTRLRRGTQDGPAVFTCAHPEVRARRIKRLYFKTEQLDSAYSAREGYKVSLSFSEQVKAKQTVTGVGDVLVTGPPAFGPGEAPFGVGSAGAVAGGPGSDAISAAALRKMIGAPGRARDGTTLAKAGLCSSWTRDTVASVNPEDEKLFGGSAVDTQKNYAKAGRFAPWTAASSAALKSGDLVFYGATKGNPYGHVGIYDGKGGVMGNNFVTYQQRGGLFVNGKATGYDAQGRLVDARGTVPLKDLGTPSGIGKPGTPKSPVYQGPAVPLPPGRPSATPPAPR